MVEKFRVPHRQYFDWGKIRVVSTGKSIIFYRDGDGERPADAKEDLHIPGSVKFRMAGSLILGVLAANLKIPFMTDEPGTAAVVRLPAHMSLARDADEAEFAD